MYLLALCKLAHALFCVGYWWLLVWVLFTLALGSIVKSREVDVSLLQNHIINSHSSCLNSLSVSSIKYICLFWHDTVVGLLSMGIRMRQHPRNVVTQKLMCPAMQTNNAHDSS